MTKHLLEINTLTLVLTLGVYFVFRFVLLSLALWIMLKIQDLNYNIPGMLGSAAAASLCDMIPLVGHYLAVAVLLLCVMKLTQAELIDVRFTVAVSYAVMFLMQMLLLSAVPGTLHVNARTPLVPRTAPSPTAEDDDDSDEPATNAVTALTNFPSATRPSNAISKTSSVLQKPPPAVPAKPSVTNAALPVVPTPAPAAAPAAAPVKPTIDAVKKFKLKGLVRNGGDSMAIVEAGGRTFSLRLGDIKTANTADGEIEFGFDQLTDSGAIFRSGGQTTLLRLQ